MRERTRARHSVCGGVRNYRHHGGRGPGDFTNCAPRMEREKAEAQAKALKKEETLRTECMRENKTTAQC